MKNSVSLLFFISLVLINACSSVPPNAGMVGALRSAYDKVATNPQAIEVAPAALLDAERALLRAETLVKNRSDSARVELQADIVRQNLAIVEQKLLGDTETDADDKDTTDKINRAADAKNIVTANRSKSEELAIYMLVKAEEFQEETSGVSAKLGKRGLVLTLEGVMFEMGKTKLTSRSAKSMQAVSEFLNNFPDQKVSVEGHTDAVGEADFNQRVSLRRAESVKASLVRNGVDGDRVRVRGLGEEFPIATNKTPEGRQQNRRVEIVVLIPQN